MKKENTKNPKKQGTQRDEDRWIDVHNDAVMIENGLLRSLPQTPRDKSVWTKTAAERKLLRSLRNTCKGDMHFGGVSAPKYRPFRAKLIIQLIPNKKYPKTTYSTECCQHDIPYILSKYRVVVGGNEISAVAKYSFNGRTYAPGELPFQG